MNRPARNGIVVLGMHRSGTSALTGVLGLAGGSAVRNPMSPTADNPRGYWASLPIARLNNRLLESAGTCWNDPAPIPDAWFDDRARVADVAEAAALLEAEFPGAGPVVCKDPRICRLLPLWRRAFRAAGIEPRVVLVVRHPVEVVASLAARAADTAFQPAAVACRSRGILLWLRYVLDAERDSRDMNRHVVEYGRLLADWRTALAPLFAAAVLPQPMPAVEAAIDAFLDPALRRQREEHQAARGATLPSIELVGDVWHAVVDSSADTARCCDTVRQALDRLLAAWDRGSARGDPLAASDTAAERVLAELVCQRPSPARRGSAARTVLFLSGVPQSVGHVYRVEHAVAALQAHGWRASWRPLADEDAVASCDRADIVTVFRGRWGAELAAVHDRCRARGIPVVFDIDDLVFDPEVMAAGCIALMDDMTADERRLWLDHAAAFRQAIAAADVAVFSTDPLAAAAARLCRHVMILPNALGREMEVAATAAMRVRKPSTIDGRPRLLFASGTATHHRDFAVAAAGIARLFARRPEPLLVIVGHLDPNTFPVLAPFRDRIECRPRVPLAELFSEVARGDVNLCPLELGNPFCEGKSAVRWLTAAAVAVPSVASPTGPLRHSIHDGVTGLLAADVAAWEAMLLRLVEDPAYRARLGSAARGDALDRFGYEPWGRLAARTYAQIVEHRPQSRP